MEYVTDLAYVRHFEADLAPVRLRLVAALGGFVPPPAERFDYCELGCGQGDTLLALAAAHPSARFCGVDLLSQHVQAAEERARRAHLANVRVLERDFSALLETHELGTFDYVVAHGVLSWVSADKRRAVLQLAERLLKPGGLLYVSYNALPGWSALEPLRQLLSSASAATGSVARAEQGLALAQRLERGGAAYFTQTPTARDMLAKLARLDVRYVAHEYLHAHWVPMYFAQVAHEMAAHDLFFVGVQPLFLNFRDLAIPAGLLPLFAEVGDRAAFESLKDFALNEFFRRDVYVRGRAERLGEHTARYLDATPIGLVADGPPADPDVRLVHHTLRYDEPPFGALRAALADGARTATELRALPSLADTPPDVLHSALIRLLVGAHAAPMLRATTVAPSAADRYRVPLPYNRLALEEILSGQGPGVLASPVAGTALPVSPLQALALRALCDVEPEGRGAWLARVLGGPGVKLQRGDETIDDPRERVSMAERELAELQGGRLQRLIELGVIEVVPRASA